MVARPLFLIGNKRSGTSHLTNILNAHPGIFVAPEADLVQALYCRSRGEPILPHALDGPGALAQTLQSFGDEFADMSASTQDVFRRVLAALARRRGKDIHALQWAGDKKPVQHADPVLFEFIRANWPDARFVHIVRHPAQAVASMRRAVQDLYPFMEVWKRPDEDLLRLWTENEQRVLEYKAAGAPIFTLTLPALIGDPTGVLGDLLDFLELADDAGVRAFAQSTTVAENRSCDHMELALTAQAREIVRHYALG